MVAIIAVELISSRPESLLSLPFPGRN